MFLAARKKIKVVRELAENVRMRRRLKQTPSYVCGTRKRAAKDCLLDSLVYGVLLCRSSALTLEQIRRQKREVVVAKRKLCRNVHDREDTEMESWRMSEIQMSFAWRKK